MVYPFSTNVFWWSTLTISTDMSDQQLQLAMSLPTLPCRLINFPWSKWPQFLRFHRENGLPCWINLKIDFSYIKLVDDGAINQDQLRYCLELNNYYTAQFFYSTTHWRRRLKLNHPYIFPPNANKHALLKVSYDSCWPYQYELREVTHRLCGNVKACYISVAQDTR